jgi:hypothetical protein
MLGLICFFVKINIETRKGAFILKKNKHFSIETKMYALFKTEILEWDQK